MSTVTVSTFPAGDMKPERQNTRQRLDADLFLIRMPVVVQVLAHAADAVAAHFGLRAVRIEHPHPKIRLAGIGGRANENERRCLRQSADR